MNMAVVIQRLKRTGRRTFTVLDDLWRNVLPNDSQNDSDYNHHQTTINDLGKYHDNCCL